MSKTRLIRLVLIVIVAGVAYWQRGNLPKGSDSKPQGNSPASQEPAKGTAVLKDNLFPKKKDSFGSVSSAEKVRGYDKFTGARLVENDDNDGDSFHVSAGGREFELRLYFVDAPEKYLSDRFENQRRRVEEQGREMGGLSPEQTVEVGKAAKMFTKQQLSGKTFTIYTYWEEVYSGDRFYGFVELPDGSYLGTRLVEQGLARIHTKGPGSKENPVPTPNGKSFFQHRDMLNELESKAKRAKAGAWSL